VIDVVQAVPSRLAAILLVVVLSGCALVTPRSADLAAQFDCLRDVSDIRNVGRPGDVACPSK
jgi:hypothetical protein